MPHPAQGGFDLPKLGVQPLADGVPPDQPPAFPGPPEDVGKAQEGEGFGLALTTSPAVLMSEPSELDDPGLVRVQLQRERLQSLLQLGQKPVRIGKIHWHPRGA
jgi:hypothetical protein